MVVEDAKVLARLHQLGFVEAVLAALRLPDLQAVSRGLGCRALKFCVAQSAGLNAVVEGGGVEVLLAQVPIVERTFAFAALYAIMRSSSKAREKLLVEPSNLDFLLSQLIERSHVISPVTDPAAALLFVTVWGFDKVAQRLEDLCPEGSTRSDLMNKLQTASITRYTFSSAALDISFGLLDLACDIASGISYLTHHQFQFFGIVASGIAFSTLFTSHALVGAQRPVWGVALNVLTLGSFASVSESWRCYKTGFRRDELTGFKMLELVESFSSYFVALYSILISGYLEDYPLLGTFELLSQGSSILSSSLCLPWRVFGIMRFRLLPGRAEFGITYLDAAKSQRCFMVALLLFQASEVWCQATLILFQIMFRPWGIFMLGFAHIFALGVLTAVALRCKIQIGDFVPMPMLVFTNNIGGHRRHNQIISRVATMLRLTVLTATWIVIAMKLPEMPVLMDHLREQLPCRLIFIVAAVGTVVHLLASLQQFVAKRWWFESEHERDPSTYETVQPSEVASRPKGVIQQHSQTYGDAVAVYNSTNLVLDLVKQRWVSAHEHLLSKAARVPRDVFVRTMIAERNSAGELVTPAFNSFLDSMFNAALGLMLPKDKNDLGKHCFGYAGLLVDEYHEGRDRAPDHLGLLKAPVFTWFDPIQYLRQELREDWSKVAKDHEKCVSSVSFRAVLLQRHEPKCGGIEAARDAYGRFTDRLFEACCRLRGPGKEKLDQHAFFYGAVFAYEFYFADARDLEMAQGCGTSTPVADNLGITRG
eukprot:TRINITY_DN22795_c0_g1_i1.p1 TRINITY_DN22795_c0_g1~~TRINITY_DN22795_c0_g1_i1.p1  ORF type:complete len:876 (-),score=131.52 TRINITY_DN22795_c0_g1_i1:269-2557(-)